MTTVAPQAAHDPPVAPLNAVFATVPETARVLRVDERTIRRGVREGQIPAVQVGSVHRVPVAWIRSQALLSGAEAMPVPECIDQPA